MRVLVTGAAGFIGSHLVEELLAQGNDVVGIDCFTPVYNEDLKRANLRSAFENSSFELIEDDLRTADLHPLVSHVDVVHHLAAIPGVRDSWDRGFRSYVEHNIIGTQRLLEAARRVPGLRVVYASSSSVYGNAESYPTSETDPAQPHSPYGVTKFAGEQLCTTYASVFNLHTVALRYFSVYGPRQRPDMGVHRIIEAALHRRTFTKFGDGEQIRDMTYVKDVVRANIAAGSADVPPGTVANIAGGSDASLNEVIQYVQQLTGSTIPLKTAPPQPGDVKRTGGTTEAANRLLDWKPQTTLREGLQNQVAWHKSSYLTQ